MNLTERHQHVVTHRKKQGNVNIIELCNKLNVSSVTISKDLKIVEVKNL